MKPFNVQDRHLSLYRHHILEASAGTGKTFSIENLVVRLLIEKPHANGEPCQLSQILVMTFTKAATRELKERIRANIDRVLMQLSYQDREAPDYVLAILEGPDAERLAAIRRLQTAAATFDEAQISTLHSFCARMLRECLGVTSASDSGLPSSVILQIIRDFFRTEMLPTQCSPGQLSRLLGDYSGDPDKLQSKLCAEVKKTTPIAPVPDFSAYLKRFQDTMHRLKQHYQWTSETLLNHYESIASDYKLSGFTDVPAKIARFARLFDRQEWSAKDLDLLIREDIIFAKYLDVTNQKVNCKSAPSEMAHIAKELLLQIVTEARDPKRIFAWVAAGCLLLFKRHIQEEDITGPDQLLEQMSAAVGDKAFSKRVASRYRFAIVDEFQDTDNKQWNILRELFLSEEPSGAYLALVGDPKQAIYAFRQADIYTYMDAVKSFAPESHASLSTNYRSCTPLIEAVNHLFCTDNNANLLAMPAIDSSLLYRKVLPAPKASAGSVSDSRGALHFYIGKGAKRQAIEEFALLPYLANEISSLVHLGKHYRDIAILVRDHPEAKRILNFLHGCRIPAILERSGMVTDSSAFRALADLLHAALRPWDSSAHIQLLGGNLLQFTQAQLQAWQADPAQLAAVYRLSETLHQHGVSYFIEEFLQSTLTPEGSSVIETLLSREGGAELYRDLVIWRIVSRGPLVSRRGLLEACRS